MKLLVTGASGILGREVVAAGIAGGHVPVAMTRRKQLDVPPGASFITADVLDRDSLDAAVAEVDAVIHCATDPRGAARDTEVTGTKNLIDAMDSAGGDPHLVYVSIVGVDRIPLQYYAAKVEAERIVEEGRVPWSIQRATQFHNLIVGGFGVALKKLPVLPVPRGFAFQVLDPRDCATRLLELATEAPAGRAPDIGGPEVRSIEDLARTYLDTVGIDKRVIRLPAVGKKARAFKGGGNLCPENPYGTITFEQYLETI